MTRPTLFLSSLTASVGLATTALAGDTLVLKGAPDLPGNGKKIVIVTGDEEYRSEESGPMLGKILSQKHGFDCEVLFAMTDGYVDPNASSGIRGWSALDDADLMIIGTRFRKPSAEDAAHLTKFMDAGKPCIGFRTATHAFNGAGQFGDGDGAIKYGEWGRKVLGEQWVSHHGAHKRQGARGVIEEANKDHAILNGVTNDNVFAPSDVYGVKHLTDADTILMRAAVTETLDPASKNIDGPKNAPMQAFAWLHPYTSPNGTKGMSFCTTGGASLDFVSEGLRRIVVNAAYHLSGLEVPAKADVDFVDPFHPSFFCFIKGNKFATWYKDLDLQPADFDLGKSPKIPDAPGQPEWKWRDAAGK